MIMKTITFDAGIETITQAVVEELELWEIEDVIIEIPNGIKRIEEGAFQECSNIVKVLISDTCTEIGSYAFYNCNNLREIVLPDSEILIGSYAFKNCRINNLKRPNLKIIDGLAISDEGELLYLANHMLQNCIIPDTIKILCAESFSGSKVRSVIIPDSVCEIHGEAFFDCEYLQNIILPSSLTGIYRGVFDHCIRLKNVILPSNLEYILPRAFKDCRGLQDISLPSSISHIDSDAFEGCNENVQKKVSQITQKS